MDRAEVLLKYFELLQQEPSLCDRLEKIADEIEKELAIK